MARTKYREDTDLMPDVAAASIRGVHRAAGWIMVFVGAMLAVFFLWASQHEIDEVTKGEGKVIPSRKNQIVQHLEGGEITEILVREGDIVTKGQPLLKIENRGGIAEFKESMARYLAMSARAARLKAEVDGKDKIEFDQKVLEEAPEVAKREVAEFLARKDKLERDLDVLKRQLQQRQQALKEQYSLIATLRSKAESLQRQVNDGQKMVAAGSLGRIVLLRWQRELSDTRGRLRTEMLKIPRAQSAITEARQKIKDRANEAKAEARKELNEANSQLKILVAKITGLYGKVGRTTVRSPVRGTIKSMRVSTVGGVVKAGEPLVEIVPLDDSLLIDAKIQPSNIAFLKPGQPVLVKITAFDVNIYGGLEGVLVKIAPDTEEENKRTSQTFYRITVRTNRNYLLSGGKRHPIIPGMTAVVNIRTGRKTVLDYIFKPITKSKARQNLPQHKDPEKLGGLDKTL